MYRSGLFILFAKKKSEPCYTGIRYTFLRKFVLVHLNRFNIIRKFIISVIIYKTNGITKAFIVTTPIAYNVIQLSWV